MDAARHHASAAAAPNLREILVRGEDRSKTPRAAGSGDVARCGNSAVAKRLDLHVSASQATTAPPAALMASTVAAVLFLVASAGRLAKAEEVPGPGRAGNCAGGLAATDCQSWIDFFNATGGEKWKSCSGNRLDPCTCVAPGRNLPPTQVTCTTTVSGTRMTELTIYGNNLVGSIPASIGNLTQLTTLAIDDNPGLNGSTIPSTIGELTNLTGLYLFGNRLTGEIPTSIGKLTELKRLQFSENSLNGSIPASLVNLTKLWDLEFQHNQLTGLVPVLIWPTKVQCSLDSVGWSPRGPSAPPTTGPCTEPNCNKFTCPLPAGSDQCAVHCGPDSNSSSGGAVGIGGYGGRGRHDGRGFRIEAAAAEI